VGSRLEGYGETGMAHLLEHMVFKGTPNHKNIPQELTEHGARPNGTTWFDRTNYFETFPATAENLEWALDLESDRMVNSFIATKDLASEMTVVRNEYESGENSPFNVLLERAMSTAFLWHNYGHSTIGARADIENVPIERLQAFYHKYYQPDDAVLVVAGSSIRRRRSGSSRPSSAGSLDRAALERTRSFPPTPRSDPGRRAGGHPSPGGGRTVVMAIYHVPAGSHPDFPAVDVLSEVLGDEPSGRLYKALVETKQAARVGAFTFQLREPGTILAFAEVRKEGSLDSARATLTRTIDDVVARVPTAEEVERAKTSLLKSLELELNSSERVGLDLSEWQSIGDWRLIFIYRDRLKTSPRSRSSAPRPPISSPPIGPSGCSIRPRSRTGRRFHDRGHRGAG